METDCSTTGATVPGLMIRWQRDHGTWAWWFDGVGLYRLE